MNTNKGVKEYCKHFEPHVEFVNSNSIGKINKANLLTYALQVFYDLTWTREYFGPERFKTIFEIKEKEGLITEPYDKTKHKLPKSWWLQNKWALVQKAIESIRHKEQQEILRSKGIPTYEDDFNVYESNDDNDHNPFIDRDTFDALTDGQLGRYEDFHGTLDELKAMIGRE